MAAHMLSNFENSQRSDTEVTLGQSRHRPVEIPSGSLGKVINAEKPPRDARPLSYQQQSMWFWDQLQPNSPLYNVPLALRLRGPLDHRILQASLNLIVTRHTTLRTNFSSERGVPTQAVSDGRSLFLAVTDIGGLPPQEREAKLQELANEEVRRPFDFAKDLMLRARLIRLSAADHGLVLTAHHIATDGWSSGLLLRELFEAYTACLAGHAPSLPELPIQYADFAARQRERKGAAYQAQLAYWKDKLAGHRDYHHLTTDYPRPTKQSFNGATETVAVPEDLIASLTALGQKRGASFFMTMLAGLQALLHRYSGHEDIFVAFPIANRNRSDIANLIGFFANTLVLSASASGNPTFLEFLDRVRDSALDAYSNQELPFEKLVEELQPDRSLGHPPLYQVMLILEDSLASAPKVPGLSIEPLDVTTATAKCDLSIYLERKDGFKVTFEYNKDLFSDATIKRMLRHYSTLLQGAVNNPNSGIGELPLLTEPERQQLLVQSNQTRQPYPELCIHELFEEQARRTPDAVAVVFKDQVLTYRELEQRATVVAEQLREVGVGPDTLVGVLLERSADLVIAFLAIFKAGGAYLPLDPAYPPQRLSFLLENSGAQVVLTLQRFRKLIPGASFQILALDDYYGRPARNAEPEFATHAGKATPDNLAYVLYTSGTTGTPKGVEITHRAVVRLLFRQKYLQVSEKDVLLQLAPPSFDVSVIELWGALLHGAKLVLYPSKVPTTHEIASLIREHHVTTLGWMTTSLFNVIVDERPSALAPVRAIVIGGEALSVPHIRRALSVLPGIKLINGYGPTENSALSTTYEIPPRVEENASSIPIGRPIATAKAYVLDRYLQPLPVGVAGELYVGGDGIARGYRNLPALTAERFIPNPFGDRPGEKIYKTGDRARFLPDGNIEYLGRLDHQVKIRGFRIELGEVEAHLLAHPKVKAATATVREDVGGSKSLVACVVPLEGQSLAAEELRNFLRLSLPEFMIPSRFLFLDAMPLLSSGKVDRRALAALKVAEPEQTIARTAPRDSVEIELVKLWQRLLGRHPIGVTDNFYDLGGHSLLAMRLIAEIESAFGKKIDLSQLITCPTVEHLAEYLRNADRMDNNSVVAMQPQGSRPPLFCIHGGGGHVLRFRDLAEALGTDQPFYGLRAPLVNNLSSPDSVESLATKYLADIKKVQPKGPYHLAGASFGGLVAYEIACQLRSQGEEVGLVALFDTGNPAFCSSLPRLRRLKFKTVRKLQRIRFRLSELREVAAGEQVKVGNELFHAVRLRISNWLWNAGYTASRWSHRPLPESLWDNLKFFTHVGACYEPRPYSGGRIVLFKAVEQKAQFGPDAELGWGKLALGGVQVIEVPGDHMSLLAKPKVLVLAAHLRERMDAAQQKTDLDSGCIEMRKESLMNSTPLDGVIPLSQVS